jgi:NitT/TauT family transport system permease protein
MVGGRVNFLRDVLPALTGLAVVAGLWQIGVTLFHVPAYVLPAPIAIAVHTLHEIGPLSAAMEATVFEAIAGFAIGSVGGFGLSMIMILVAPLERALMPVVVAINFVPTIAFVPMALIWFGLGANSKIFLVALSVSFVVLLNALQGLKQPEDAAVNLLRSFGAGPLGVMWRLRLPAAMPSLVTGLRVGVSRSMIVAVVAEMLGAVQGLGRVIYESTANVDYLNVWAGAFVASMATLILYGMLVWIDERLVWWR